MNKYDVNENNINVFSEMPKIEPYFLILNKLKEYILGGIYLVIYIIEDDTLFSVHCTIKYIKMGKLMRNYKRKNFY